MASMRRALAILGSMRIAQISDEVVEDLGLLQDSYIKISMAVTDLFSYKHGQDIMNVVFERASEKHINACVTARPLGSEVVHSVELGNPRLQNPN